MPRKFQMRSYMRLQWCMRTYFPSARAFSAASLAPSNRPGASVLGRCSRKAGRSPQSRKRASESCPVTFAVDLGDVPVEAVLAGIVPRVGEADNDHVFLVFLVEQIQLVAVMLPQTVTLPFGKGTGRARGILKVDSGADFIACQHNDTSKMSKFGLCGIKTGEAEFRSRPGPRSAPPAK